MFPFVLQQMSAILLLFIYRCSVEFQQNTNLQKNLSDINGGKDFMICQLFLQTFSCEAANIFTF